jgi:signal transduction histidine kinase
MMVEGLRDADEGVRLRTARKIARRPDPAYAEHLRRALVTEDVGWVRSALELAIARCEAETSKGGDGDAAEDLQQSYQDGRRDGLRQALHELSPVVGLAYAAMQEDQREELQKQLDRLRSVTAALRGLVTAAGPPVTREIDIAEVLTALAKSPPVACRDGLVGTLGPVPFVARADTHLLELAVQPLLINAIEAVTATHPEPNRRSVMLSWGADGEDNWIAVIDEGPGPPNDQGDLFTTGTSTKRGHLGLGLETARTAISSMQGSVELRRNERNGATALLRWPRA